MNMERRHGADKPVIRKALVELDGKPFKTFEAARDEWAKEEAFLYPGPIQYFGPSEVADITTATIQLENE
jgi:pyrophosphate--fructose-6-phosphate 1-phosphotransferase